MKLTLLVWTLTALGLSAQHGPAARTAGAQAEAIQPGVGATLDRPGLVVGTAWYHDNWPIAHALLRLRDVTTGQSVMTTEADDSGRFTFRDVMPGSYVVELVEQAGDVRAVGQTFSLAPGETVATFIRLGARVPWFHGFFNNATAAALTAAASLGVTAVGDGLQPASARF
jgi:hypothetical protein